MSDDSIVVIGIGNDFRGDDAVGLYTARLLEERGLPGTSIVVGVAEGTALIDHWESAAKCFVIDCAVSGANPGTRHTFQAHIEAIPGDIFTGYSTHNISVTDAVELAKVMGKLPKELIVYGIEGCNFEPGAALSKDVESMAREVAREIATKITATASQPRSRGV